MKTNITRKLAGIVALLTGDSLGIGEAIAKRLAPDRLDVTSVFVTNGGYNGVQQVLRLSTPLAKGASDQTAMNASVRRVKTIDAIAHRSSNRPSRDPRR
jgi:NAD(P)-dependent dehydrogenase (short-subunit alcohol dehydrogenase family)